MLKRLYWFLGFQYAKFQFKNEIDHVQSLTEFFTGAKSILVILPIGYEEAIHASNSLRRFRNRLQHLHLTVIASGTRATSLIDFPKCEVIRLIESDINRFFLPSKAILQRICQREFDVAMDLNLDFILHSAYICKASRAKVRIGLVHPKADIFFNVQINITTPRTVQALYEKFAAYLAMF